MDKNLITNLSPPWYTYHHKILAMFGKDPEVTVKALSEVIDGKCLIMILVSNKSKAEAIKALLINPVEMGNITLTTYVYGPDENGEAKASDLDIVQILENAFMGNPVFNKVVSADIQTFRFCYCVFKKQVIQFWNDNTLDLYGNCNCLAEDIARDIFGAANEVFYCTDIE